MAGRCAAGAGADDPADKPPAVFAPLAGQADVLRTVSGREVGELLRLTRDSQGVVDRMHWATYRFTQIQETFDQFPPGQRDPRSGGNGSGIRGVDPIRW